MTRHVIVTASRNMLSVFLMLYCIEVSISGLIATNSSNPSTSVLPHWMQSMWFSGIIVGAVVTLVGKFGKKLLYFYIERIGLTILTGLAFGWGLSLLFRFNPNLIFSIAIIWQFSFFCGLRILQINKGLKEAGLRR